MEDLPEFNFRKTNSSSPDFLDLERTLRQEDVDMYSKNMDRLFANDEIKNSQQSTAVSNDPHLSKEVDKQTPSARSSIYFSSAAFWKRDTDSIKVGVILSRLEHSENLFFLVCDASKKVLGKRLVSDIEFCFSKKELGVLLNFKPDTMEDMKTDVPFEMNSVEVRFVDFLTLLRFAVTALIRSKTHDCFKLYAGSGDVDIDETCDIRYNITDHSLDEEGGLKLPDERKGVKTRLSQEKLNDHFIYKWIRGLQKGCHLLVKSSSSTVYEITIDKVRKPIDFANTIQTDLEPVTANDNLSEKFTIDEESHEHSANGNNYQTTHPASSSSNDCSLPEKSENQDILSSSPPPLVVEPSTNASGNQLPVYSTVPEDIRDALHRIVGIELDRIEMRLNAKIEKFQLDMSARLDRQTDILQQVLDKVSKK